MKLNQYDYTEGLDPEVADCVVARDKIRRWVRYHRENVIAVWEPRPMPADWRPNNERFTWR